MTQFFLHTILEMIIAGNDYKSTNLLNIIHCYFWQKNKPRKVNLKIPLDFIQDQLGIVKKQNFNTNYNFQDLISDKNSIIQILHNLKKIAKICNIEIKSNKKLGRQPIFQGGPKLVNCIGQSPILKNQHSRTQGVPTFLAILDCDHSLFI